MPAVCHLRKLSEALSVLGHAELFEPIGDLLHRRPRAKLPAITGGERLAM
jgi:hypothetical protein